jgi:hypothetical protein
VNPAAAILPTAFRELEAVGRWPTERWEMLIRQARRADVLATLAARLRRSGILDQAPMPARAHLDAATTLAAAQERDIRREVAAVAAALEPTGTRPVLLKGAAYLMAGLPAAEGRVFSDVDILVPREQLAAVESTLMLQGWATTHHNRYDQRYYRTWMHELPPMRHVVRQAILDVHHSILPLTGRFRPSATLLLASARGVAGSASLRVLAPADMVLHSATHLMCNDEFSHGFRDLLDLESLLHHFAGTGEQFYDDVAHRAAELGLMRVWYYALRYCAMLLGTPLPRGALDAARTGAPPLIRSLMDALFARALQVDHPAVGDGFSRMARRVLYVRGHWLRMPAHLLAYHLTVKAFRREEHQEADV